MTRFITIVGDDEAFNINMDLVVSIQAYGSVLFLRHMGGQGPIKIRFEGWHATERAQRTLTDLMEVVNE